MFSPSSASAVAFDRFNWPQVQGLDCTRGIFVILTQSRSVLLHSPVSYSQLLVRSANFKMQHVQIKSSQIASIVDLFISTHKYSKVVSHDFKWIPKPQLPARSKCTRQMESFFFTEFGSWDRIHDFRFWLDLSTGSTSRRDWCGKAFWTASQ